MSLARVWRRQLYGASSVALIVPSAMLGALIVLALGGGFSRLGVLGQIFVGPPAPSAPAGATAGGHGAVVARSLPVIPAASGPAVRAPAPRAPTRGRGGGGALVSVGGSSGTGGALTSGGASAPVVGTGGGRGGPTGGQAPTRGALPGSAPPQPASPPGPSPQPQPTPVDQVVKVVTSVTQQVPAPTGPIATQAVQAAGSAADGLLPSGSAPPAPPVP